MLFFDLVFVLTFYLYSTVIQIRMLAVLLINKDILHLTNNHVTNNKITNVETREIEVEMIETNINREEVLISDMIDLLLIKIVMIEMIVIGSNSINTNLITIIIHILPMNTYSTYLHFQHIIHRKSYSERT
jgi:hypothetical protein